jgi:hypothetical protein
VLLIDFLDGWLYELWRSRRLLSGDVGLVRASLMFKVAWPPLEVESAEAPRDPIVLLAAAALRTAAVVV